MSSFLTISILRDILAIERLALTLRVLDVRIAGGISDDRLALVNRNAKTCQVFGDLTGLGVFVISHRRSHANGNTQNRTK